MSQPESGRLRRSFQFHSHPSRAGLERTCAVEFAFPGETGQSLRDCSPGFGRGWADLCRGPRHQSASRCGRRCPADAPQIPQQSPSRVASSAPPPPDAQALRKFLLKSEIRESGTGAVFLRSGIFVLPILSGGIFSVPLLRI